uniref:Uncharacterized protein n=1 Tax=Cacopsylla melanoneura TaxID=428564 RepID=A0A8D8R4U3_9HEMI
MSACCWSPYTSSYFHSGLGIVFPRSMPPVHEAVVCSTHKVQLHAHTTLPSASVHSKEGHSVQSHRGYTVDAIWLSTILSAAPKCPCSSRVTAILCYRYSGPGR